jgi:hypothetical protein
MYQMDEETRAALASLVQYSYEDEHQDYEEQDEHGRENHIFVDIARLSAWLDANN